MVDSWGTPNWVTTIAGRACLTTWEQLLDKFAKSQAELIIVAHIMQLQRAKHVTRLERDEYGIR